MLSAVFALFSRAVAETLNTMGQTASGAVFSILSVVLGFAFAYARRGPEGARLDLQAVATALTPVIALGLMVLTWHLVALPYRSYQQHRETATQNAARVKELEKTLEDRRHSVDVNEPGVHNLMGVIAAFQKYGRAVNPLRPPGSPPAILVSAAEESADLAWQVTQWAVFGSGIGNGNVQNHGVRPENLEAESQRGMVPRMLLVHAVTETPAILNLVSDLEMLLPTKLVFAMPATEAPIPPTVVWLQFGFSVRWRNDTR